jgi:NAD-dependent histone deacetylase SIR2
MLTIFSPLPIPPPIVMDDLVSLLSSSGRVLVCVGAGISVSAGIPDFRSPGRGVYSSHPEELFHIENFRDDPLPFFSLAVDCFPPAPPPTPTHRFLATLRDYGRLLRVYTQNVDGLETAAGLVPDKDVIHAHGTLTAVECSDCHRRQSSSEAWRAGAVQSVSVGRVVEGMRCDRCSGFLKPAVVFYGEPLSRNFFKTLSRDAAVADCLLVIGTSLSVYPFAAIPALLPSTVPRAVINQQPIPVGPNTVVIQADCDQTVSELRDRLGW